MAITGTGSATYDSNEATEESSATFTLESETTATCTITGSVDTVIISESAYPLPFTPLSASVSEAGSADYGVWADDVQSNFADWYTSLTAQGTLNLTWTPGYDAADITDTQTLLSVDGTTKTIAYDPQAEILRFTNGYATAVVSCTCLAGTSYSIKATWGDSLMQLSVDNTISEEVAFITDRFLLDDDINLLIGDELNYIKDLKVLKASDFNTKNETKEFLFDVVDTQIISGEFSTTDEITVHWGDGTSTSYDGTNQAWSHDYGSAGGFTVSVVGKSLMTKFKMNQSGANITHNMADLPVNLTDYVNYGSNTTTGDIVNLPINLTEYINYGLNITTGNIADLPVNLTGYRNSGLNTTTGSIADLPVNLTYYSNVGSNTVADYTSKTWTTKPETFKSIGQSALSESEINQLLIDLDDAFDWSSGTIELTGNCAAPTGLGLAAKNNMIAEGASVMTN